MRAGVLKHFYLGFGEERDLQHRYHSLTSSKDAVRSHSLSWSYNKHSFWRSVGDDDLAKEDDSLISFDHGGLPCLGNDAYR